jgi:hypothetical protein
VVAPVGVEDAEIVLGDVVDTETLVETVVVVDTIWAGSVCDVEAESVDMDTARISVVEDGCVENGKENGIIDRIDGGIMFCMYAYEPAAPIAANNSTISKMPMILTIRCGRLLDTVMDSLSGCTTAGGLGIKVGLPEGGLTGGGGETGITIEARTGEGGIAIDGAVGVGRGIGEVISASFGGIIDTRSASI